MKYLRSPHHSQLTFWLLCMLVWSPAHGQKHPILEQLQQLLLRTPAATAQGEPEELIQLARLAYGHSVESECTVPASGHVNHTRLELLKGTFHQAQYHSTTFRNNSGLHHLYLASDYYSCSVRILEDLSWRLRHTDAVIHLLDRHYYILEHAIDNRYELYRTTDSLLHLHAAFDYAERSRALSLKKQVYESGYSLPPFLKQQRIQLERRLRMLENSLYTRRSKQMNASGLEDTLFRAKRDYHRLLDSITRWQNEYHTLPNKQTVIDIFQLQRSLAKEGKALIQYFVGYRAIYIFRVQNGSIELLRQPRPKELGEQVEHLQNSIQGWAIDPNEEQLSIYIKAAHSLYQQLFAPLEKGLPTRLLIVADDILQGLPFDILLRKKVPVSTPFGDYPYLLYDYQISYAYAAQLPQKPAFYPISPQNRVLGFAPYFDGLSSNLYDHPKKAPVLFSTQELDQIANRFPLDRVEGKGATRQRFLQLAPKYKVIHLATHAEANRRDGSYSFLCFAGTTDSLRRLYARDLRSLDIGAELVVLSACETGIGSFTRGEGVISLARGFTQAGARSVISTLWPVSDQATAKLMAFFYAGLKEGLPKDQALQKAKLQYLEQAPPHRRHPFFWGPYIGIGDMSPLEFDHYGSRYGLLTVLLLGISFALFRRWRV